jgi:plasmid replication initiation protein
MKKAMILVFVFSALISKAQVSAYDALLKTTPEIIMPDSLNINTLISQKKRIDTGVVRKLFSFVLPTTPNSRLKNRNYFLAGKITTGEKFNLLVLLEEKKKIDSNNAQIIYLVTTKKDGSYIGSIEAAVIGNRKKSAYNTSCWLYKDYRIVQDSKITTSDKSFATLTKYTISSGGRFMLEPNY